MSRLFLAVLFAAGLFLAPELANAQAVEVNYRKVAGFDYEFWLTCDRSQCEANDSTCVECGAEGPEHYYHFTWRFEDHWYELGDTVRWRFGAKPREGAVVIFATRKYTEEDPEKNMKRIVPDDDFLSGIVHEPTGSRFENVQGDSVSIEITRDPRQTYESAYLIKHYGAANAAAEVDRDVELIWYNGTCTPQYGTKSGETRFDPTGWGLTELTAPSATTRAFKLDYTDGEKRHDFFVSVCTPENENLLTVDERTGEISAHTTNTRVRIHPLTASGYDDATILASDNEQADVTGSWDPNAKFVLPKRQIDPGEKLLYTITFENMGNGAAIDVNIHDTLPETLNASTFTPLGSSHPFEAGETNADNIKHWIFDNIVLPPGGTGWVAFTVNANDNVAPGTLIRNTASIVFDNNPPIVTEPARKRVRTLGTAGADEAKPPTEDTGGDDADKGHNKFWMWPLGLAGLIILIIIVVKAVKRDD